MCVSAHGAAVQAAPVTFRRKGSIVVVRLLKEVQAPRPPSEDGGKPGRQRYRSASQTQRVRLVVIPVPQSGRLSLRKATFVTHSVRNVTTTIGEQREGTCCCDAGSACVLLGRLNGARVVGALRSFAAALSHRNVSPGDTAGKSACGLLEACWRCPVGLTRCQASLPFRLARARRHVILLWQAAPASS